jgi:hypothetical protein
LFALKSFILFLFYFFFFNGVVINITTPIVDDALSSRYHLYIPIVENRHRVNPPMMYRRGKYERKKKKERKKKVKYK